MKALAFKELREVFGIAIAALGGYLALVLSLMGAKVFEWIPGMPHGTTEVPFTGEGFFVFFGFVSVLFAIALGFRQSIVESCRGTYLFLLHRPLNREAIFLTKLATGLTVFFLCSAVPILVYGSWAALPGRHPSPFEWSMTAGAWRWLLLTSLLYLGAFLSGIRKVRWFGTRLLPLIASVTLLIVVGNLRWWTLAFPLTLVLAGMFVSSICFVARVRDYA